AADTYELTREYARLRIKYETDEPIKIRKKEKKEYEYWLMIKDRFERYKAKSENDLKACQQQLDSYTAFHKNLVRSVDLLEETYGLEEITPEVIDTLKTDNKDAELADRKSTRLNSSHVKISYAVFCLQKKEKHIASQ